MPFFLSFLSILGTPNETIWPDIRSLPNYKDNFPAWAPNDLASIVTALDADGIDLLQRMLAYEPGKRISAKQALLHPYFRNLQ